MGRFYKAIYGDWSGTANLTTTMDVFEIVAASSTVVIIHEWELLQINRYRDNGEEMLLFTTNRGIGSVTPGSGGVVGTFYQLEASQPNAISTVNCFNTTIMAVGSGTLTTDLECHVWNIRFPYKMIYIPEMRPIISPTNRWTLELESTPSANITAKCSIIIEEIV